MIDLEIGIPVEKDIDSELFWTDTGIILEKGNIYDLEVIPDTQEWIDGYGGRYPQVCTANGFSHWFLNLFSFLKRSRKNQWFALMGSIDREEIGAFKIGTKYPEGYKADKTGELTCFANDAKGHYKNNKGIIKLTITRRT
jgi:hypothetical protein